MVILGIVLSGLAGMFVSVSNAQVDMNRRFEAQQQARLALDKIRREVHCASSVVLGPLAGAAGTAPNASVTLVLPAAPLACATGTGAVTWCVRAFNGAYGLYRIAPSVGTCTGGILWAEHLRTGVPFTYQASAAGTLPKLGVSFPVQIKASPAGLYKLVDDVVLRNGFRG